MNRKELLAFRMVLLTGSMTAAAQELHTTQPTVSRLVVQLERTLGFLLFHRTPNGVVPTSEATDFFRHVERLIGGYEALENEADAIRRFGTRQLRIASIPTLALSVLPDAVEHFHNNHDDIRLTIETSDSQNIADVVGAGFCDIGLVSHIPHSPGVASEKIYTARCVCVLPPGHRLAERKVVGIEDLDHENFLSITSGSGSRAIIDRLFRDGREDRRVMWLETPFATTICAMVGRGLGVSVVSELVARLTPQGGWVTVPFKPPIYFESYLLLNPRQSLTRAADSFIGSLKHVARAYTASRG